MSKKKSNPNTNSSMFLYTALIFIVALILIIIAFFGQKNLMELRRTTDAMGENQPQQSVPIEENTPPAYSEPAVSSVPSNDEFAIMTNTISNLKAENSALKETVGTCEKLFAANSYVMAGNKDEANKILLDIDASKLTSDQLILYNQLLNTIDEGKE